MVEADVRHLRVHRFVVAAALAALVGMPSAATATLTSVSLPAWQTDGRVAAIARANGVVYVGGTFSTVTDTTGQTVSRANAAAFDAATGQVLPWAPNPNGLVQVIKVAGSRVYLGGAFTRVAGAVRLDVASVSTSGVLVAWKPSVSGGAVHDLAVVGTGVYLAGSFTTVNSAKRPYLARVRTSTGALDTSFAARPDREVWAIVSDPARLVIGGAFRHISGHAVSHIGAVRYSTGVLVGWAGHPYNAVVLGLAESSGVIYAALAGNGGQVAAYTASTGRLRWQTWLDGNAKSVTVAGGVVVVGGHFQNVCAPGSGEPCNNPRKYAHLVSLWLSNGHPAAGFQPFLDSILGVYAVLGSPTRVYVGGDFTTVNTQPQAHFASFGAPPVASSPPVITGTPAVGDELTASTSTWTGLGPFYYTYQWLDCPPASTSCQPITNATADSYQPTQTDAGQQLEVTVTATGPAGAATATSAPTGTVTDPAPA